MPLYAYYGADTFTRREAVQRLKSELDADGSLATNTVFLNAAQASAQEIIASCDTVPFLGGCRLVIVEGLLATAARSGARRSRKQDDGEAAMHALVAALLEYAPRLPETTTLLLIDGAVSPAKDVLDGLRAAGTVQPFPLPDPKSLPNWVQQRAREIELRLEPAAARALAQLVGPDPWRLANELEKLKTYAAGDTVRETDVRTLVTRAAEQKAYLLADAIADGKAAQALRILHEIIADEQPLQVTLATVAGRYRRLAIARDMLDAGASGASIGGAVNSQGYGLERLLEQASRHSPASIRAAYARLVQAELDTKRGTFDDELSLELAINDLAGRSRPAA